MPKLPLAHAAIGTFKSPTLAAHAVQQFQHAAFNPASLSIVGRDYHSDEHVVGYYHTGGSLKYWGHQSPFWSALWHQLSGAGFFLIPGIGPLLVAGPIVARIIAAIEGPPPAAGVDVLTSALCSLGIPSNKLLRYEVALKMDKLVLVCNGTPEEVEKAKHILAHAKATEIAVHLAESPVLV